MSTVVFDVGGAFSALGVPVFVGPCEVGILGFCVLFCLLVIGRSLLVMRPAEVARSRFLLSSARLIRRSLAACDGSVPGDFA